MTAVEAIVAFLIIGGGLLEAYRMDRGNVAAGGTEEKMAIPLFILAVILFLAWASNN